MNKILTCCKCGKEFKWAETIYACGDLFQCEDCAIKQMQENDNKDQKITELEAQLTESEKHHKWVIEFLEKYKIEPDTVPEYSENPIIEYCKQIEDFRWCDEVENKKLKEQLAEKEKSFEWLHNKYAKHIETHNQDKIDFAVEQLERALDIVENGLDDALKNISLNSSYYNKILDKLDQLIKEIKGK